MRFVTLTATGIALVAASQSAAASRPDSVTLSFRTFLDPARTVVMVWYGQVSSGAAGEDVEIVGRECLTPGFHQVLATKTVPGGGYDVQNPPAVPSQTFTFVQVNSGTTFRARWGDQLSAPVTWRTPLFPEVIKVPARGLTLRAVAPTKTVAPCFRGGPSATFRS